jgi:DNA-binding CsgD family transcriptional regulator
MGGAYDMARLTTTPVEEHKPLEVIRLLTRPIERDEMPSCNIPDRSWIGRARSHHNHDRYRSCVCVDRAPLGSTSFESDSPALRRLVASIPALQTLEMFGVPYLAYVPSTPLPQASPEAAALLERHGEQDELWLRISELRVNRLGALRSRDTGRPESSASKIGVGAYSLAVHRLGHDNGVITVVVLHPRLSVVVTPGTVKEHGLTSRETEVACLIAKGESAKRIAAKLGISQHTARHHTERVFEKLGVRCRAAVAVLASSWTVAS